MADVSVKYKGAAIATMDSSGTKTLETAGKYCEGDLVVEYVDPEKPTQEKSVTPSETAQEVAPDSGKVLSKVSVGAIPGAYVGSEVTRKAAQTYTPGTADQIIAEGQYLSGAQTVKGDANLTGENIREGISIFGVPGAHKGGITPSGTKTITGNGTYDVAQFATAEVDVQPTNFKQWTYISTGNNEEPVVATLVPAGDEWVKTHYADENLVICVKPKFKCAPGAGLRSVITLVGSNRALCSSGGKDYYSIYTRYINDGGGVNAYTRKIRLADASAKGDIGDIGVTAAGKIFINMPAGAQYMLQAGEWSITAFLL